MKIFDFLKFCAINNLGEGEKSAWPYNGIFESKCDESQISNTALFLQKKLKNKFDQKKERDVSAPKRW